MQPFNRLSQRFLDEVAIALRRRVALPGIENCSRLAKCPKLREPPRKGQRWNGERRKADERRNPALWGGIPLGFFFY